MEIYPSIARQQALTVLDFATARFRKPRSVYAEDGEEYWRIRPSTDASRRRDLLSVTVQAYVEE
jgi:hypothetical protein